jgi:hypothetical protein
MYETEHTSLKTGRYQRAEGRVEWRTNRVSDVGDTPVKTQIEQLPCRGTKWERVPLRSMPAI